MARVRFISNPKLPRDWADKPYVQGYECEMSEDEKNRWLHRGVIEVLDGDQTEEIVEDEVKTVEETSEETIENQSENSEEESEEQPAEVMTTETSGMSFSARRRR